MILNISKYEKCICLQGKLAAICDPGGVQLLGLLKEKNESLGLSLGLLGGQGQDS